MIFNSIDFSVFFLIFFTLYWLVGRINLKSQNVLLLAGSYFFYAWWDWRFLFLLFGSSIFNFYIGKKIEDDTDEQKQQKWLYVGIFQGIIALFFFKYYNFFIDSLVNALSLFNLKVNIHTLKIILPLGISFYTFRTMSYLLDIYNGKIQPTKSLLTFLNYVAFFPSLISGPIDRAAAFIPQLEKKRKFDYLLATDGLRQILWGLFKKIVVADNCAELANNIFDNYTIWQSGSTLFFGAFFFTVQLYADFSGYSDMAIGFGKLIGFRISKNFDFPYFAQNIVEYWRKWHISLTSWIMDFVFTPLSFKFRRYGKIGIILAVLINFSLVGLWHGSSWTYVLFGVIHGCLFIPAILNGTMNVKKSVASGKLIPSVKEVFNIAITFSTVTLINVIFRAETLTKAVDIYKRIIINSPFSIPELRSPKVAVFSTVIFFAIEWIGREQNYAIEKIGTNWNKIFRFAFYYILLIAIIFFSGDETQFIYFKF